MSKPKHGIDEVFINRTGKDIIQTITLIQQSEKNVCDRYIISNTKQASNILEILLLAFWSGIPRHKFKCDIIPLFESIDSLRQAPKIMEVLFNNKVYKEHLRNRNFIQTIMLGFSDGTKDGGYVSANCEILLCKKRLFELAKEYKLKIIFFDGRGGPPARGGGNTNKYYRAMDGLIKQEHIQLTIQGQTVSSNFGTLDSAQFNLEQLITAVIESQLFPHYKNKFQKEDFRLLDKLSRYAYDSYHRLINHPLFLDYLQEITPLKYFGELNIASRPSRRKFRGKLNLDDLRAITFVNAWAQMKQNIPGYYGLGTALNALTKEGFGKQLQNLYQHNLFFRTLIENAMQSLLKSNLHYTAYLSVDPIYGSFWKMLEKETILTRKILLQISKQKKLLATDPINYLSIKKREKIVLPLLIIQQYALIQLRLLSTEKKNAGVAKAYKNLIKKSMITNVNASRNSA